MADNVRVLVFDPEGRVLVVSENPPDDPRTFKLPGGKLKPGESPRAGARREIREELGEKAAQSRMVQRGTLRTTDGSNSARYIFRARMRPEDVVFGPDIADHRWVHPDRIPESWPNHDHIVAALRLR